MTVVLAVVCKDEVAAWGGSGARSVLGDLEKVLAE